MERDPTTPMKLVIFDLDATLVDSAEDIARSVNDLLSELGHPTLPHQRIHGFIGDGVRKLLERALRNASRTVEPSEEDLARAEALYLPIYRGRLLQTTVPYPGVVPALETLHGGRTLAVLTNKPRRESLMILEGLGLRRYFQAVYGGDSFDRKKPDPMGVLHLMRESGAPAAETLLVGDSLVDLETARNASIRSCLVTYGIGEIDASRSLAPPPDFRVDDLRALVDLLVPEDPHLN